MKKNKGFTLLELIIVIIILGVLSVVAAPKFIDVSTDAEIASLKGFKGALSSAMKLFYSKAIIQGKHLRWETINGTQLSFGYPRAVDGNLETVVDFPEDNFKISIGFDNTSGAGIAYVFPASNEDEGTCHVKYVDVVGTYNGNGDIISYTQPNLSIDIDGC